MKTLNFKVKIFMLLCVGALFFSCALFDHDEYGTLVINLPGSNSSRAINDEISYDAEEGRYKYFLDNLIYRVECSGPSRIEPQDFKPPSNKISMRLPVGDWTVTVKVYNAKDENIALSNNTDSTTIEEGKTSEINLLSIGIDTKRCDIASFKITSPVTAVGTINTNNLITVNVPNGTDVTAMGYSLTHTGRTIEPAASGTLSFTDTKSFTVTAVNGDEKPYIVEVVVAPPVDIGGGIPAWVGGITSDTTAAALALTLTANGYTVTGNYEENYLVYTMAFVEAEKTINNKEHFLMANKMPFTYLVQAEFEEFTEELINMTPSEREAEGITNFEYTSTSMSFNLDGYNCFIVIAGDWLIMQNAGGGYYEDNYEWPDDDTWSYFYLPGLTKPDGTFVVYVEDEESGGSFSQRVLEVSLLANNANAANAAYSDLKNQIISKGLNVSNEYTMFGVQTTEFENNTTDFSCSLSCSGSNISISAYRSGTGGSGSDTWTGIPSGSTLLIAGEWKDGNLASTASEVWYSLNVTIGQTYYIWWNDAYDGDYTQTADVKVSAWYSDGTPIFPSVDSAWDYPQNINSTKSGMVYIKVRPYASGGTGTFAIAYNTSNARPVVLWTPPSNSTLLSPGNWESDSISYGDEKWYNFDATSGQTYYIWWNDSYDGDDTQTADIAMSAWFYADGDRTEIFLEMDSGYNTPQSYTPIKSGTVYINVSYIYSSGTFRVAYNTSSVRP